MNIPKKQAETLTILPLIFSSILLTACGGGGGGSNDSNGTTEPEPIIPTVTANSAEPAGGNCEYGGTRVDSGLDSNGNGILDLPEVIDGDVSYLCADGQPFEDLVYLADTEIDGQLALYRAVKDSNTPSLLAAPVAIGGSIQAFKISPDRTKVAFTGDLDTDEVVELYVISLHDGLPAIKVSGTMPNEGDLFQFDWSPDSAMLAFRGDLDTDGVNELYTVMADGSNRIKVSGALTVGGEVLTNFYWSPNSSKLLYHANQDSSTIYELYTVNADGTTNLKISGLMIAGGNVSTNKFRWSPNGERVAFIADKNVNQLFELFSVLPDGTNNTKISGTLVASGDVANFSWHPDSNQIAYQADQETNAINELYTVDADGTIDLKVSHILALNETITEEFQWSPDGSRLAYISSTLGINRSLFSVLLDGSSNTNVSDTLVAGGDVLAYKWAPDSSMLAYVADKVTDEVDELFTALPDTTLSTKVSGTMVAGGDVSQIQFEWAPDSGQLTYIADQDTDNVRELYTTLPFAVIGGGDTKISGALVSGGNVNSFLWSPDSNYLAYSADKDTDTITELFTASIGGLLQVNNTVSGLIIGDADVGSFAWE